MVITKTIYVCSHCGKEYKDYEEAESCSLICMLKDISEEKDLILFDKEMNRLNYYDKGYYNNNLFGYVDIIESCYFIAIKSKKGLDVFNSICRYCGSLEIEGLKLNEKEIITKPICYKWDSEEDGWVKIATKISKLVIEFNDILSKC